MTISCINYHPFDYTKQILDYGKAQWNDVTLDLPERVTTVALATICALVFFLADLALSAGILVASAATQIYRAYRRPSEQDATIRRVTANPYRTFPSTIDDTQFLKDALTASFSFLDQKTKNTYKQLIRDQGVSDEGEEEIDIYQWISSCLLVHYLRTRSHETEAGRLYPAQFADAIFTPYNNLTPQEKTNALLKIIDHKRPKPLNQNENLLVLEVRGRASLMNQHLAYTTTILFPAVRDIDNF